MTFRKIIDIFKKYDYEILIVVLVISFTILSVFRLCTYTSRYFKLHTKTLKNNESQSIQPKRESSGEIECRRVLESIFKRPFNKIRPDFLRNHVIGTNNLELDCYNHDLKLAVEYNGQQHYKFTPYFHKSYDAFHNQKYRDYIKSDLCRKNGITLIEVPYTVQVPHIEQYLITKLKQHKLV